MLAQARVKTITLHTRKEAIAIFEELKNKINAAFQSQSTPALQSLLAIIRIIYYLAPFPMFLSEINSIGTLPVTFFLENLLIKSRMMKFAFSKDFQGWTISLLYKFKEDNPSLDFKEVKVLKEIQYDAQKYTWDIQQIIDFIHDSLQQSTKRSDYGLFGSTVLLLRNFLVHSDEKYGESLYTHIDWSFLVAYLTKGCWILNNILREETAICIIYFLCLKKNNLCRVTLENGIVNYLLQTLSYKFISESFGRKIIEFLTYLLFYSEPEFLKNINFEAFQDTISKFIGKYNNAAVTSQARNLVALLEKKFSITHEMKLQKLNTLIESESTSNEADIIKNLSIILLYSQNVAMRELLLRSYPKLLKCLFTAKNENIIIMLLELLSICYKSGQLDVKVAETIISKVDFLISEQSMKERLNENRKKMLIDLVKILKTILENTESADHVIGMLKYINLQSKFWKWSDCTNYEYEKQLIGLSQMLGTTHTQHAEASIFEKLQDGFIMKSRTNLSKASPESYEEISLLDQLIEKSDNPSVELKIDPILSLVISSYIHGVSSPLPKLLGSLEKQDQEKLRKKINLASCKLMLRLMKFKQDHLKVTKKLVELSSSQDQAEETMFLVGNYFKENGLAHQFHIANTQEHLNGDDFAGKVKHFVAEYFANPQPNSSFVLSLTEEEISFAIIEIQGYESQQNLIKTIRILTEIAKIQRHCHEVFERFGPNLAIIYNYILSNPTQQQKEGLYLLQSLLLLFIKTHIDQFFSDIFHDLNFWIEILTTIDSYFEVYLTKKRIILLQHIFEFLEINKSFDLNNVTIMMSKGNRNGLLKAQAFHSKGQTLGCCYSSLILLFQLDDIESIALQHKENIISIISEASYLHVAKFVEIFYKNCPIEVFTNYNLEDWAEKAAKVIEKQLKKMQVILNQSAEASRRLRILNYYIEMLNGLNIRKDLNAKKSLLFLEESVLINCLKSVLYYIEAFKEGQFKKYYLDQLASKAIIGLSHLYRNNFKHQNIRSVSIVDSFEYLLSINNQQVKIAVCEMMRVLLLKKEAKMMECTIYNTCKEFKESLPALCQQQIYHCEHIEHVLYEGGDLEQQFDLYFQNTVNNRVVKIKENMAEVISTAAYLIEDEEEQVLPKTEKTNEQIEPLFLEFAASERQVKFQGESEETKDIFFIQSQKQVEEVVQLEQQVPMKEATSIMIAAEVEQPRQQQHTDSSQLIQKLEQVWSQQQLFSKIQEYLENPQPNLLKQINNRLVPISSQQYYNLLLKLFLKSNSENKNNPIPSLHEIQTNIVSNIPSQFCQPDDLFYDVLASGIAGSRIALKCKNMGLKGLQICTKKFMNSLKTEDIVNYAELLSGKKNFDELKYLKSCKIYELINDKLPVFVKNSEAMLHLGKLVSETCKYPPLCNSYEIAGNLCNCVVNEALQPSARKEVLNTIKNLATYGEKHKLKVQNSAFLSEILIMLEGSQGEEMRNIAQILVIGADDCIESAQLYQQLNLQEIVIGILKKFISQSYYHFETYLYLLKILECLAILPQSAARMLRIGYMTLCNPITQLAIKSSDFELIGCLVNILRGLLEELELNLSKVVFDLEKDGLISYLLFIGPYVPKSKQVQSYLGIYAKLLPNYDFSKKILVHLEQVLLIMSQIARDQLLTQFLLELWMKVLFLLIEINRFSLVPEVLKSNIFFSAANSLRPFLSISDKIINMNSRMSKELSIRGEMKGDLTIHGYADFLVQIMRMLNLPIDQYRRILDNLSDLHRHRPFPRKLCTELFAVVIVKLETHWKDDIALSSVNLLKAIRRKVEVTAEFGANMLEFFGKFLTQSSKVNSFEYYKVSKQVICLLSHFLIFSEDIRFLFRTALVVDILKNWVRIARALDYDQMDQVFKLFFYSLYSAHGLYLDLCGVNSKRLAQAEHNFQKGWQVMLYRLNGTYKNAILKIDKSKHEIIAFKSPDGVVKDKYRIHLKELLVIRNYQKETDIAFAESVFTRTINIFQHKAPAINCLTLIGLTEDFEVREISIQAESREQRTQIQLDASFLVSRWHQAQIEEESRAWQLLNSKLP